MYKLYDSDQHYFDKQTLEEYKKENKIEIDVSHPSLILKTVNIISFYTSTNGAYLIQEENEHRTALYKCQESKEWKALLLEQLKGCQLII